MISSISESSRLHFYILPEDAASNVDKDQNSTELTASGELGSEKRSEEINTALAVVDHSQSDQEMIERALFGAQPTSAEAFEKECGLRLQEVQDAVIQELVKARLTKNGRVSFGGLKIAKIKKWKYIAEFDELDRLTFLFVGRLKAKGSFTKVYFTFNQHAISVPKKGAGNAKADLQIEKAFANITKLHERYAHKHAHSGKVEEILKMFNFSVQEFSVENKSLIDRLPPIPKKMMVQQRPILIAPLAICVKTRFRNPPSSKEDICYRLEILADVAFCMALAHAERLPHGDIKPANMLINSEGKGFPHDWGGGNFFNDNDSNELAAQKYKSLTGTCAYINCVDHYIAAHLSATKAGANEFLLLAQARDVYALGLSTLEAMLGLYKDKDRQFPLKPTAYKKIDGKDYAGGTLHDREKFTCVMKISKSIDCNLQILLNQALNPVYKMRISAAQYAKGLNDLRGELIKKTP